LEGEGICFSTTRQYGVHKQGLCPLGEMKRTIYHVNQLSELPMSIPGSVKEEVFNAIKALLEDESQRVTDDTVLIGGEGLLDSMKLVELCLALEDKAMDLGFEFDWTSDAAMSKSRSMFRTAGSLVNEFMKQMEIKK
jgi:acyl carrier protein